MRPDDDQLTARLERFLAARIPDADAVHVTALARKTEGFSQETFSVDVEVGRSGAREQRGFVVKREPIAGLLEPYDLEPEFRVLHALSDARVLSPPTPWFERDPAVLERPFYVMERLPGDVPIPATTSDGRGPFDDAERRALGPQLTRALAALHAVDWRARGLAFLGAPAEGREAAARELARWRVRIERAGFPLDPVLAEALGWLGRHVPETREITLVHGDYRLGNFLVARDDGPPRLAGILDWEMVHLGDPLEDLAWCASPLWRAGTAFASGVLEPEAFADEYGHTAGRVVDPARMRFYDVLALVKMSAIMLTGIRAFVDGRTADLRMAIFDHQLPYLLVMLAMARNLFAGGS